MHITAGGIQIGPLLISAFGLIVIAGVVAGTAITWQRARSRGHDSAIVFDLDTASLVLGVIVGRIFYVWSPPPSAVEYYSREWYLAHPLDLLAGPVAVWDGGLGTAGVMIGALLGALLVLRYQHVDLWEWADILAPGALTATAIIPWANLLTGQLLGPPTTLPWGVPGISPFGALEPAAPYAPGSLYQPTPAYLSLWAVVVLVVLLVASRRAGQIWTTGLMALFGALAVMPGFFLADMLRPDSSRPIFGLSGAQTLALSAEALLIILAVRRARSQRSSTAPHVNFTEN